MKTLITQQYLRRLILRFATLDSLLDEMDPCKIASVLSRLEGIIHQLETCSSPVNGDRYYPLQTCHQPERCIRTQSDFHATDPRKQLRRYLTIGLDAMEAEQLNRMELVDLLCAELEKATSEILEIA